MCGIIAVLSRPTDLDENKIREALSHLVKDLKANSDDLTADIKNAEQLNDALKAGMGALLYEEGLLDELTPQINELENLASKKLAKISGDTTSSDRRLLEDLLFSIRRDRLEIAQKANELTAGIKTPSAISTMIAVQIALSGIDKLEVRGRDSAGIQILLYGGELSEPESYIYKVAHEIGELGHNTAQLKKQILADKKLRQTLETQSQTQTSVLAHTRWASVGLISTANAHPQVTELGSPDSAEISAVVNGYIDNYQELIEKYKLDFSAAVTTDSRVVPALIAKNLASASKGKTDFAKSFRNAISELEGSVAIATISTLHPDELHLSLSGSGQALYVGLTGDAFIVASEPYGLIAEADQYLRMEDECIHLSGANAGKLEGISRFSRDGKSLPIDSSEIITREISSKDIARGEHPHFFVKEIYEAPDSVQKTLNGCLLKNDSALKNDGRLKNDSALKVQLGKETLNPIILKRIMAKDLKQIYVVGQGTAAVAAHAVADAIRNQIVNHPIAVSSMLASELSSFALSSEMSDSLVIAVSQSGTTTDTNRTVDLVRSRGAVVLSIVNRRSSDLVDRSDGVFYTSDGRDVEMSVASTKAFYSQAVAGILLGCAIADLLGIDHSENDRQALLENLVGLPEAMQEVLSKREEISEMAVRLAPSRRWWAVVGSGRDRIAAEEVRIKLSELCYKSISQDAIEDKKHIDLSAEPLILVCASGLSGAVAQDMVAEVAIYCAHRAAPVIFADSKIAKQLVGRDVVVIPTVDSRVAFILSALAGHLFSYEAALAIDAGALPMHQTQSLIEKAIEETEVLEGEDLLTHLTPLITEQAKIFEDNLRSGEYNGHLQASTANRLSTLYRYATGIMGLESYQLDFGCTGTPTQVIKDLTVELSKAIDELSRPIDAIRHQAKTVTVGISRSDEAFLDVPLVEAVLQAGTPKDQLSYESLKTLAGLNPVVEEIKGYIRYFIQGDSLSIVDKSGEAAQLESRVEKIPELLGTKHRVTTEQKVLITKGRMDGRTVIIIPEVKNAVPVGLTLLHIKPHEFLPASDAAEVMRLYKGRLEILEDAVRETEPSFNESLLGEIPIMDLLDKPIAHLADKWSGGK